MNYPAAELRGILLIKKIADTTYCGPPFIFKISRYILKYNDEFQWCVDYKKIFDLQSFNISCQYRNLPKMLDFKWIS